MQGKRKSCECHNKLFCLEDRMLIRVIHAHRPIYKKISLFFFLHSGDHNTRKTGENFISKILTN